MTVLVLATQQIIIGAGTAGARCICAGDGFLITSSRIMQDSGCVTGTDIIEHSCIRQRVWFRVQTTGLVFIWPHFCIKQKVFSRMRHTELSLNVRYNILLCSKEFLLLIRLRE